MTEVFWTFDHILLSQGYKDPIPHKHLAKHLIFSTNDYFNCTVENEIVHCKGICIDSNTWHTVNSNDNNLLVFLFDETSFLAEELSEKYLKGKHFCIIDEKLVFMVISEWKINHGNSRKLNNAILSVCKLNKAGSPKYDDRIDKVLKIVNNMEGIYENTVSMLCKEIYLSQSRLSHLFKEQVGVSLSSYLVFEKMRKTYSYVLNGENITNACVHAGFCSSSHFSAVCKRMFGLSFADFIKTSEFKAIV